MQKQKTMPVGVLTKHWKLGKKDTLRLVKAMEEMSLLEVVRLNKFGKAIRAHDKIIDFCREQVVSENEEGIVKQHKELLKSFLSASTQIHWHTDVWYRPWWDRSVRDEYVMENLGYHLVEAKLERELWGVLCDARL
ncbi:hypothetical protein BWQ96_00362 [Gracilariopsis chorda]|uniref:Uncharacterized protein n=1 Tax=Gracilariopsis chorda TaxID=448386 RepID=A0A2V3JAM0_9FLOR|nr:hypothetical protein BWQ96_00362 [Gracilariopsis chorda]|eukprot:PXF49710.1 hypothetical protein BWQ96_00362 [Gracilariopsis chorda]